MSMAARVELTEAVASALWQEYGYDKTLGSWELTGLGGERAQTAAARCRQAATAVVDRLRIFRQTHAELVLEALTPVEAEPPPVDYLQPIHVWADGSGTTADSPAGAGYVIRYHDARPYVLGLGVPLGKGTNNYAELSAIQKALESIPLEQRTRPVRVTSDSQYALGAASGKNKVNANVDLVMALRRVVETFRSIEWKHCHGHTGVPENEACDRLAGRAAREQRVVQLSEVAEAAR